MNLTKNVADQRVQVRLVDGTGAPVTGMVAANILGGVFTVIKADGTTVDISVSGTTWFEIHTTKAPGLYQAKLTAAAVNTSGVISVAVQPAAAAFVGTVVTGWVGSNPVWDEPRRVTDGTTIAGTFGEFFRTLRQVVCGRTKLNETTGTITVYKEDNATVHQQQGLRDANGNLAGLSAVERLAAP